MHARWRGAFPLACVLAAWPVVGDADQAVIAGTQPGQRPASAPQLTTVDHPGSWYTAALQGVSRPYPYSLRFLEDQGDWYTPFDRPGMQGRYDIRGWYHND